MAVSLATSAFPWSPAYQAINPDNLCVGLQTKEPLKTVTVLIAVTTV